MTASQVALSSLIDYAGLYPPAALDMATAVRNYLGYREHPRTWMLGRFIVDLSRVEELRDAAGGRLEDMRFGVLAAEDSDPGLIEKHRNYGVRIESVEIKCNEPFTIARMCEHLPADLECYFEIPVPQACTASVDVIAGIGARVKLRMGGVTAQAIPDAREVAERLRLFDDRGVSFKATAGLHHPVRSQRNLSYAAASPRATMHGFMNLLCAAAAIHFGASAQQAADILEEQDPGAFQVSNEVIGIHNLRWASKQIREVREFFTGFGSCSFTEPVEDLEALRWLPTI